MNAKSMVFVLVLGACGAAPTPGAGADAGVDGGGVDGGADAGTLVLRCGELRPACDIIGTWNLSVWLGRDAGGPFSPCLPLPQLDRQFTIERDGGGWCSTFGVSWAPDAGCVLALDYGFTSSNPSETYRHAIHLELAGQGDGGLLGDGTYTLTGGSNCTEPLDARAYR